MGVIINYYDGIFEKDETKEYKLVKEISTPNNVIKYYESVVESVEEKLKKEINSLNQELQLTQDVLDVLILGQI